MEIRPSSLNPELVTDMTRKGIDIKRSLDILNRFNAGRLEIPDSPQGIKIPVIDGKRIIDISTVESYSLPKSTAMDRLEDLGMELPPHTREEGRYLVFEKHALINLGEKLLGQAAWGVLNGGSATSYADRKKNQALGVKVFNAIQPSFEVLAPLCEDVPKGLSPAYINPDGSPGESFLLLKMRASLRMASRVLKSIGKTPERPILPMFQMTSAATHDGLARAYAEWADHPWLKDLVKDGISDPRKCISAIQPLTAAFTHSSFGSPRSVFEQAWGIPNSALALPGGHGQSFWVLADVYSELLSRGYRYAWIGNVDNSGFTPDPIALAVFALSGAEAAYELAYRTAVDIKGGILVEDDSGKLNIAELGQAMSFDEAMAFEQQGSKILFNCATGLFDLKKLIKNLPMITEKLPVRVSDQDKDAGKYSQAEQNTWESMRLFEHPLCLAVDKSTRFMAAKLLADTILGSIPLSPGLLPSDIEAAARALSLGMQSFLSAKCALSIKGGKWSI